jgi:hypothetical protein
MILAERIWAEELSVLENAPKIAAQWFSSMARPWLRGNRYMAGLRRVSLAAPQSRSAKGRAGRRCCESDTL